MIEGQELLTELGSIAVTIGSAIDEVVEDERGGGPTSHDLNWASEIGHPCRRHLTYCRTRFAERRPKDIDALFRFKEGSDQETIVEDLFRRAGYKLIKQQVRYEWPEYQLSGKIDGMVPVNGRTFKNEIKSLNPLYWETTKTIEEIKNHPKWWIRKIPSQLNSYLFMDAEPGGFLTLKTFGKRPRILPMLIDYELGERDVETCEIVNRHIAENTLPDRITYQADICDLCDYDHICQPVSTSGSIVDISDLDYRDIMRYLLLKDQLVYSDEALELKRLTKELIGDKKKPGRFYGKDAYLEDVVISTKIGTRKTYKVPQDIKDEYIEVIDTISTTIERPAEIGD